MKLVIVDDNLALAENLAEIFGCPSVEVFVFGTAGEALRGTDASSFDAALVDLRLPDMSGLELLVHLRRRCPAARYVLMSAFLNDERLASCGSEVDAVLTKPAPLDAIASALGVPS